MKAIVTEVFVDKYTGIQYNPGETIDIADKERLADLENRGLAKRVETVVEKKTTKKVKE